MYSFGMLRKCWKPETLYSDPSAFSGLRVTIFGGTGGLAVQLHSPCWAKGLVTVVGRSLQDPPSPEVVVQVAAASINPMDWKIRSGSMKRFTGSKFPPAMGTDFAATVESVGSKVSALKPSNAVVGTVPSRSLTVLADEILTTVRTEDLPQGLLLE